VFLIAEPISLVLQTSFISSEPTFFHV